MYERSAIVLEKYFNKKFGFNKQENLKSNLESFKSLFNEIQKYQSVVSEEEEVIEEFDKLASKIQNIQKSQEDLYNSNLKLEEERYEIFNDLELTAEDSEKKLNKIEKDLENNSEEIKEQKEEFIRAYKLFEEKQKERNKCTRNRRILEKKHFEAVDNANSKMDDLDSDEINNLKKLFKEEQEEELRQEIIKIMLDNGKEEKVPFNKQVIENAVSIRTKIAKEEMDCYILAYERNKKLLSEIKDDNINLQKYAKALNDIELKLEFLKAEKKYIVDFLDNERMTSMNGLKVHNKLMKEACDNFELDIAQINNLYELILKEISGKSTKKAYKELYNKTYLRDIEEKEKNFEKEINNINIRMGTIINSNYWRIEGIKNIYEIFQKEVSERFQKDLSEFKLEEIEEDIKYDDNPDLELEQKIDEKDSEEIYKEDSDDNEYYDMDDLDDLDDEDYDLDDLDDEDYDLEDLDDEDYNLDDLDDEDYDLDDLDDENDDLDNLDNEDNLDKEKDNKKDNKKDNRYNDEKQNNKKDDIKIKDNNSEKNHKKEHNNKINEEYEEEDNLYKFYYEDYEEDDELEELLKKVNKNKASISHKENKNKVSNSHKENKKEIKASNYKKNDNGIFNKFFKDKKKNK